MDRVEAIHRFLRAAAREHRSRAVGDPRAAFPFVTISRESGAGGRVLAQAILDAFEARADDELFQGWKVFDRTLCELVAGDPELDVGLRSLLDESSVNAIQDAVGVLLGRPPQQLVHHKVIETIRQLAVVGKAIVIGRGGAFVTRDLDAGIHLRLVAPFAVRVQREARGRGADPDEVETWVRKQDRNRASLVERLSGHRIDDPLLYDLVLNTQRLPLEVAVHAIVDWVERLRPR